MRQWTDNAYRGKRRDMKQVDADIKAGELKPVYLFYGKESYLKRAYRNKLKEALLPGGDTMNYGYFEGEKTDLQAIISLADTMPFFAEKRLIVVENSGFFKNKTPELAEYIPDIPQSACLVFVEDEVDKRGKSYKAVKEKGREVEFKDQEERVLIMWAAGRLKAEHKKIREEDLRYFLGKVGSSMERIDRELEKLICYTYGREEIAREDVDAVCCGETANRIFDMIEAMVAGKQEEALGLYYDLLALKEPAMRILFLIARQYNILMQVKDLQRRSVPRKEIGQKVGLPPFVVGKYIDQSRQFGMDQLKGLVRECVLTEEEVKTGRMMDVLGTELLIVKFSGGGA